VLVLVLVSGVVAQGAAQDAWISGWAAVSCGCGLLYKLCCVCGHLCKL